VQACSCNPFYLQKNTSRNGESQSNAYLSGVEATWDSVKDNPALVELNPTSANKMRSELIRVVADGAHSKAVISSEAFMRLPPEALKNLRAQVEDLADSVDLQAVVFYRNFKTLKILEFLNVVQHSTATEPLGMYDYTTPTFHDMVADTPDVIEDMYLDRVATWNNLISAFGPENVTIIDYEAARNVTFGGEAEGSGLAKALLEVTAVESSLLDTVLFKTSSDYLELYMDAKEIASRQMWAEFRSYAKSRFNCTVMYPWEPYNVRFSTLEPLSSMDLPMRCTDTSVLDESASDHDRRVRRKFNVLVGKAESSKADPKRWAHEQVERAIKKKDMAQVCELDVPAIRRNQTHWNQVYFRRQLELLPFGACLEEQDQVTFSPPPAYDGPPLPPPATLEYFTTSPPPPVFAEPPPPAPPSSPPPLKREKIMRLGEVSHSRDISCRSRSDDGPLQRGGVPTQYVHVPKAAGSAVQVLLRRIAKRSGVDYSDTTEPMGTSKAPVNKTGTVYGGHQPIVTGNFLDYNPMYITTMREPLAQLISIYDYTAGVNISEDCAGPLDNEGRHIVIDGQGPRPGPTELFCKRHYDLVAKERRAAKEGIKPDDFFNYFYWKHNKDVRDMVNANQMQFMVPRMDRVYSPSFNEASLGCAMKMILEMDIVTIAERIDSMEDQLAYHLHPAYNGREDLELKFHENEMSDRPKQVLSPETVAAVKGSASFIMDERLYAFADRVAKARGDNALACNLYRLQAGRQRILDNTDWTGVQYSANANCTSMCEDVLTENEANIIANAVCVEPYGPKPEVPAIFA